MDFRELIHPDYRELVKERAEARLRGADVPWEYEYMILPKQGGVRWVNMTAGVIEFEGRPAIIATLFDVTDRKRAEEETVKLFEERIAEEKRHLMEKKRSSWIFTTYQGITTNISILSGWRRSDGPRKRRRRSPPSRGFRGKGSRDPGFMHILDSRELLAYLGVGRNQGTNMVEPHCINFTAETTVEDIRTSPAVCSG
jgi:hypothetical protein